MNTSNKRRLFYSYNQKDYFQIFSFTQEKDGSIYCKWPDFSESKWLRFVDTKNGIATEIINTPPGSEKLSLHGSGVVKFRKSGVLLDSGRIKGLRLLNTKINIIGPRHLFTALISEPKYLPSSKFMNRLSDSFISAYEHKPFVIMFFAMPQRPIPLQINFMPNFDIDFFGSDFLKNIGCGLFSLSRHDVVWFAYKTKDLTKWPKYSYIFYYDGFMVPIFIARKIDSNLSRMESMTIVLKEPKYELHENRLSLILPFPGPEEIGEVGL